MKDTTLVSVDKMKTLEQYVGALVTGTLSLSTLDAYHARALKLGFLSEDETETAKTISWEIVRLLKLYKVQLEHLLERTEVDQDKLIEHLKSHMLAGAKTMIKQQKSVSKKEKEE